MGGNLQLDARKLEAVSYTHLHVANAVSVGMSFEAPALSMAAVAGQSGRMAPVGGGLPTGMYSPSAAFDRVGAGAYDRPSAMGYGYQESTPFGEVVSGASPYGVGFDAMAGFGLRAACLLYTSTAA